MYDAGDWECGWEDQFKCRAGPCVNRTKLCDFAIDCKGSWDDEDGCRKLPHHLKQFPMERNH